MGSQQLYGQLKIEPLTHKNWGEGLNPLLIDRHSHNQLDKYD